MNRVRSAISKIYEISGKYRVVRYSKRIPEGYIILKINTDTKITDSDGMYQYWSSIRREANWNNSNPVDIAYVFHLTPQFLKDIEGQGYFGNQYTERKMPRDVAQPSFKAEIHGHIEQFYRYFTYSTTVDKFVHPDGRLHFDLTRIRLRDYIDMIDTCEEKDCRYISIQVDGDTY